MTKQSTRTPSPKRRPQTPRRQTAAPERKGFSRHSRKASARRRRLEVFHIPVRTLLLYFLGVFLFHFTNPTPPLLWLEIAFEVAELSIFRLSRLIDSSLQELLSFLTLEILYLTSLFMSILPWVNRILPIDESVFLALLPF